MKTNRKMVSFTLVTLICFLGGITFKERVGNIYLYIRYLLFLVIFCIGTLVNFRELLNCMQNKFRIIISTVLLRILYVPLIAFISVYILPLPKNFSLGVMYLGIVPSAMIATVFTRMVNGDININVFATFIMLMVAPVTIPILSIIYLRHSISVDFLSLFGKLFINVVIPLILGIIVNQCLGKYREEFKKIIDIIIIVTVGLVILGITGNNGSQILTMQTLKLIIVLTIFYVLAFFGAMIITAKKMVVSREEDKKAIRNELSLSDCALSSVLSSFSSSAATVPSAIASFWQIVCVGILNLVVCKKVVRKTNEERAF